MYTISYKTKTNLIKELEKQNDIKVLEEKKLLKKLTSFSKKKYADIYFHSGTIDNQTIEEASNSKKTIVNSKTLKEEFISKGINKSKIEVIYPSITTNFEKTKEIKKRVCKELEIDSKKNIILFNAKNIKSSGVKEFIENIFSLNQTNFMAIIAADSKQIYNLKFVLSKLNYQDKIVLVEDYKNIDDLYLAADIFLLPTHNKNFATNVLKAMYCKTAVFTTYFNHVKELVDVFSTMEVPNDASTPFKVDALLMNKDELKNIKKQNRKIAKEYTLSKNIQRVNQIIQAV